MGILKMWLKEALKFMKIKYTKIKGVAILERTSFRDERGSFERIFCKQELESMGLNANFVQSNVSHNIKKGTLRGLHSQVGGYEEDKLVTCISGSLWDVCVDVRKDSPTYCQYVSCLLTPENGCMLYIPKGCAHGYLTLTEDTTALYFVTQFYTPKSEKGYRYNDPAFHIEWPDVGTPILSKKDLSWELLQLL